MSIFLKSTYRTDHIYMILKILQWSAMKKANILHNINILR